MTTTVRVLPDNAETFHVLLEQERSDALLLFSFYVVEHTISFAEIGISS